MKVTFKTGSEVNYGNTNGELFFASNTKQIMLNGIKYIPKKLSELTNDSGFISSITKSMVEGVLTGNITSHTHSYLPLSGGTLNGTLTLPNINISGEVSSLPSHYFHYLYTNNNVYEHFGQYEDRDKVTYGNFRVFNGEGSYKTLRIGGDGTFKWDGVDVSLNGHTHSYLPLSGGKMSNTNLVTNLNADLLDGYNASNLVKFYLSPMSSDAPADSAKSWFTDTMPAGTGAIVYNVPGYEKTIIAGKSTGPYGHMLQLNYGDNYLRILRYNLGVWMTTDWEKISAGYADVSGKWSSPRTITLTGSVTGSVSIDGSANVSLDTTTNHTHSEYLSLDGGTLDGTLTVPTLTATGGIVLGVEVEGLINGSLGIKKYDNTGFIGFSDILGGINGSVPFEGISLGWGSSPETSANSVRINDNTFTYKGNSVLHSGNLGYTSSGLSRAVQKDANGNLFIVAPSLFEQSISNNYPKNLRWITEDDGQLAYDTEENAGTTSTVQVSIPVANGTSKGFMKSTSTVTDVTGYTPCPVVSGTPYYKLDAIELDYTDLGIVSGSIESNVPINTTIQEDGNLGYLLNYTVDNIPRLLTIALGSYCKYFFWLQQTDDDNPIVAYYHCQFNNLWLVIDSPNMEVRISQGTF